MGGSSWSEGRATLPARGLGLGLVPGLGCPRALGWGLPTSGAAGCCPHRSWQAVAPGEGLELHQGALLRRPWGMGDPSVPGEPPSGLPPNGKGLAEHLPGTGVALCPGPEFWFPKVRVKCGLFYLQPWGSSTCWEELSQPLGGSELCSFPALQHDCWRVYRIYAAAWSE